MKEDFDEVLALGVEAKDIWMFAKHAKSISSKYDVCEKTVYNRFLSMYGKNACDVLKERIMPTKEQISRAILNCSSPSEFKDMLNLPHVLFSGIYDRVYGVSTFSSAKEKLLMEAPKILGYNPNRCDNISILMSQYIGDGSYDRKRHILRIDHGQKQAEYLRWKVALIHSGYNKVYTEIKQRVHKQGHEYVSWYSGRLGNVDFPLDKVEAVRKLTPIGWLLLYFDDGHYGQDITITTAGRAVCEAMQAELLTYGVSSRISGCTNSPNTYNVTMCGGQHSIRFYKNFIEPFIDQIPDCMLYKTKVKI